MYAVGRVRVLERSLVEKAVFKEASEERDISSALKIIFDTGKFSEDMVHISDSNKLDEFLEKEEKSIYRLMVEILIEKDILELYNMDDYPERARLIAEKTGYPFFIDYLRHKIDLGNLKIFCRMKYSDFPKDKLVKLISKGGFLDDEVLIQNFDLSFGEIGDRLQATPYYELLNNGIDVLEEDETFVELERGIEDFLMAYLRRAKYIVFGPEPLFAYGLAKKKELSLLRLLGIGKLNNLPVDILKMRISETYV